uniref:PfkB domain-containing protein n=1 Tax=Syphacia muris TaxID=451379 RepID=A0A0N5ASA8_9BILA
MNNILLIGKKNRPLLIAGVFVDRHTIVSVTGNKLLPLPDACTVIFQGAAVNCKLALKTAAFFLKEHPKLPILHYRQPLLQIKRECNRNLQIYLFEHRFINILPKCFFMYIGDLLSEKIAIE